MRKQKFVLFLVVIIFSSIFMVLGQSQMVHADSFYFENEPNNTQSAANGLVGKNITIVGQTDSVQGVADWYKIPCIINNIITFHLAGNSSNITATMRDNYGLNAGTLYCGQTTTYNPGFNGYIYIQITGTPNTSYTFSHTTPIFYEIESNNTRDTANSYVCFDTIVGTTDSGTSDWFKISCIQNYPITFYLDGKTYYISGSIYNNNGTYLGAISYQNSYVFTPSYNGYIYVEISGYSNIPYSLGLLP